MRFGAWVRLLMRNRFRVAPNLLGLAATITLLSMINSVMRLVQETVLWPVISRTRVTEPPVFIIGHWRSGTTLLHELLMHDERFVAPSTLQCMNPNHFLLTGWIIRRFPFLLPGRRPMDDMRAGWDLPQEDEFALANLGQPSPYLDVAFAREPRQYPESLTLEDMTGAARESWKRALSGFLRRVTVGHNKPLLIKSPTHTARVKTLLDMYPNARFILITRDPCDVFASTIKLWHALERSQGLQHADPEGLKNKVMDDFIEMFGALNRDVPLIPDGQFSQMTYADLLAAPLATLDRTYSNLGMDGFDGLQPKVADYFSDRADYQAGRYRLDAELTSEIDRRWRPLMVDYGHGPSQTEALNKS